MMIQHVHFVVHRFRLPPWRRLVGQSNVDTLELVQKLRCTMSLTCGVVAATAVEAWSKLHLPIQVANEEVQRCP